MAYTQSPSAHFQSFNIFMPMSLPNPLYQTHLLRPPVMFLLLHPTNPLISLHHSTESLWHLFETVFTCLPWHHILYAFHFFNLSGCIFLVIFHLSPLLWALSVGFPQNSVLSMLLKAHPLFRHLHSFIVRPSIMRRHKMTNYLLLRSYFWISDHISNSF